MISFKTRKQVVEYVRSANNIGLSAIRSACERDLLERKENSKNYLIALFTLKVVNKKEAYKLNKAISKIVLNFSDVPSELKIEVSNYINYVINTPASINDVIGNAVDCAPAVLFHWFNNKEEV